MNAGKALLVFATAIVIHLCLAAAPAPAQSQEERARAAFRLGRAHYDNGEFVKAAKEFQRAFELSGKYQLLYNVYLAYRDANMTRRAAEALRAYLDSEQDIPNRVQLEAKLRALDQSLKDKKPPAAPSPSPVQPAPTPAPTPAPGQEPTEEPAAEEPPQAEPEPAEQAARPAEETPAEKAEPEDEADSGDINLVPFILMGSGGAMIVGSIFTGVMAASAQSELEDKCPDKQCPADADLDALRDTQSRGETMAIVTDVLLFGGIAVAGTGLVLLLLDGAEEEPASESVTAGLGCSTTGCAGAVRVAF